MSEEVGKSKSLSEIIASKSKFFPKKYDKQKQDEHVIEHFLHLSC